MSETFTPECAALVGLEDVATMLGVPPEHARTVLESRGDYPVATYRGRDLWLSDTVHDAIAERRT